MNTIQYLNRTGCQWEMLPHDLLPKSTAYEYFAQWRNVGTWQAMLDALRSQIRVADGREPTPQCRVHRQSIGEDHRGRRQRPQLRWRQEHQGRKRHLLVDTLRLLVAVLITGAGIDAGNAAPQLLEQVTAEQLPRLKVIFGDNKDHNKYHNHALHAWLEEHRPGWRVEVKKRPEGSHGFTPLEKRWVVERANAWNGRCRRHSNDYERRPESSAAMIQISNIHLMLRRIAPTAQPKFNDATAA